MRGCCLKPTFLFEEAQLQIFQAEMRFVQGTRSGNEISSGSCVFVGWLDPAVEAMDTCEPTVSVFLTRFFGGMLSSVALRLFLGGMTARNLGEAVGNGTRLAINAK